MFLRTIFNPYTHIGCISTRQMKNHPKLPTHTPVQVASEDKNARVIHITLPTHTSARVASVNNAITNTRRPLPTHTSVRVASACFVPKTRFHIYFQPIRLYGLHPQNCTKIYRLLIRILCMRFQPSYDELPYRVYSMLIYCKSYTH